MPTQVLIALVIAAWFEQCTLAVRLLQAVSHDIVSAVPASGVHIVFFSQIFLQRSALLLPLLPPQPCIVPTANANNPTTPTKNPVSRIDILETSSVV
jgi:hypothetical protein